jgi:MFS family permease
LEKRHPAPLLNLALLGDKEMGAILALSFFQGLAMYSSLFFLSFYAQSHPAIRASGSAAGMMLSPAALGQVATAPLVGFLISKTGYRVMTMGGIVLTALSLLVLVTEPTHLAVLAGLLLASRIGGTIASIPLAAAGLEARQAQAGAITGLRQLSNVLGGVVGPVALSALLPPTSAGGAGLGGFARIFLLMGVLLILTLPIVRFMPARE